MTIVVDKVVEDVASKAVNDLIQKVANDIKLVFGIESKIIDLTSEIETFYARLVDASKIPRAKELQVMKVIVKKFQDLMIEAQDAVAKYITEKKNHEDKTFTKCLDKVPHFGKVNVCASEIQSIKTKINAIRQDHEKDLLSLINYPSNGQNNGQPHFQARPVMEKNKVLGFEDDLKIIKDRVTEASNNFIVIPIVGIAGAGKTTFAAQLFGDEEIINMFDLCIWVHVSQNFNGKQKFIDILHQINKCTKGFNKASKDRLVNEINRLLKGQKYFIVLDDVWNRKDWHSLKGVFPINSKGSRVLVTARYDGVIDSISHTLTKLSPENSWLLLKNNVFGEEGCSNPSFEEHGRKIAKKCNGLPLAIIMIADSLCKYRTIADWERVAKNPFLEINREGQSYHELVMLSYEHLPHEKLKICFLYFASFPMGYEISVWKLIRLWIAEEFIPARDEWGYPLDKEVEAHKYLNDLVDRNLVMVMKRRVDGQIKTCRIHNSLHEFCKSEAAKKHLFRVIDEEQTTLDVNATSSRRLCFYSITNIFDEESNPSHSFCSCYNKNGGTCPSGEHVHTLLLSPLQKGEIQLRRIPNTFPLLRVLDIESLNFKSLPDEIYDLHLLRYLAITTNLDKLPKQFKKLHDLETLVFRTTKDKLEIEGGIWNMEKLRHVRTNTSAQLPSPPEKSKGSSGGTDIRTLSTISPTSCRKEIISKTPKLQKLNISGNLEELLEEKQGISLFRNLQMLDCLENLKLFGQSNKVLKVPRHKFPRNLRKLTLSNTLFDWSDMSILGSLDKLEVLKLEENSFKGEHWVLSVDVIFKQLQYLRIAKTNLVTWKAASNSFPTLERLVLRNCTDLEGIPDAFADVHSLQVMELFRVTGKAVDSARKVHQQRHDKENVRGFDLFVTSLSSQTAAAGVKKYDVVGFDDEVNTVKDRLSGGSKNLTIISIVGLLGLGKTTLAKMLFDDYEFQYDFFTRLWIHIPESRNIKEVFLDILSNLTDNVKDYENMLEEHLAHKIKELLEGEKYFIVMDSVWTMQDWNSLKVAFPNNMSGSRVLVTTQHHEVGLCVDSADNPHQLKILTDEESLELLEKKVLLGTPGVTEERCSILFRDHGSSISTKCKGIPFVVKWIADVLNNNMTSDEWERIAEEHFEIIDCLDENYNPLARLNYDKMDVQLRNCFLYLAAFPVGHVINAWKLICLWIAEGFFPVNDDRNTAEKYLKNLVDKNLLRVQKRRADGQIKTCYIPDMLHQFCKIEAANKDQVHEMEGNDKMEENKIPRRLCINSSVLDFLQLESKPSSEHVRSFLSFCSKEIQDEHLATIPKSFPILRVVDVESLNLKSLPEELYHLYRLRYLAVSTEMERLPQHFNNFQNMETLVFNTSQHSLEVEADIWSMPKLRHLCSIIPMQLPSPTDNSNNSLGSNIQTLSFISPSSCTAEILSKMPNLQKLGIRGNLVEHMESNNGGISLFENLQNLSSLHNLKLLNNEAIHCQPGKLQSVPQSLRKLTLSNTSFEWKDMCILGALNELEVLKLKEYAFSGESWELNDDTVFKQLRFLLIGRTDLVSWRTSKSCFPVLEKLVLKHCTCLREIPSDFVEAVNLKLMELYCTNEVAANFAREIIQKLQADGNDQFKLLIDPPDN